MLYRPNYCCHCGEKIDRAKWTPLTSRRFCDFCEIEQKQHDLLPRAAMVVALLVGAAGLTSYLAGSADTRETKAGGMKTLAANDVRPTNRDSARSSPSPEAAVPNTDKATANSEQRRLPQNSSTEAVHFCGAPTKKGTPCTRRVKTKGRCWQHASDPANMELR